MSVMPTIGKQLTFEYRQGDAVLVVLTIGAPPIKGEFVTAQDDYLQITEGNQKVTIPFSALALVRPG